METNDLLRLLTIPDVAARLSMSKQAINMQVKMGNLKTVHIGRSVRVTSTELDRFILELSKASQK